ncbi:hypothetical protein KKA47_06070 [bacterium]|nr:hypothetical protein [bacterium]
MYKILKNSSGVSIVAAVVSLLLLSVMGMAVVALVIANQQSRVTQLHKNMAFYVWQVGTEVALREIDKGGSPEIAAQPFGGGNFITDIVPRYYIREVYNNTTSGTPVDYATSSTLNEECLTINADSVTVGGSGSSTLQNLQVAKGNCESEIKILGLLVTAFPDPDPSSGTLMMVTDAYFDGVSKFSGSVGSGSFVDLSPDITINNTATHTFDRIIFNESVSSKQIIVTLILDSNLIRVIGSVGNVTIGHQVSTPLAADCMGIDVSSVSVSGFQTNVVEGIILRKGTCVDIATLDAIEFNFYIDGGQKLRSLTFDGATIYADGNGVGSGEPADIYQPIVDTNAHTFSPITFSSNVSGKNMLMILTFSDTSFLPITFKVPQLISSPISTL